ncbi:hypothetical protein GCM10025772_12130 [Ferrimonas gelatinilytica]|uniref:Uncharacterized protein n=1 Tax=Ferrimonas gelatinilytica TaxID=1255257 RepID=A0ABP9S0W5_9GAMM
MNLKNRVVHLGALVSILNIGGVVSDGIDVDAYAPKKEHKITVWSAIQLTAEFGQECS